MFYDNYVKWCNSIGKSPSAVALDVGLKKSTVTRWKNGTNPTDATVAKLAAYFGIDSADLLDNDTKKETSDNGGRAMELDDFSYAFHELSGDLTDDQKAQLLQLGRLFVKDKKRHEQEKK